MTERVVRTQAELDAALADQQAHSITIDSDPGVWLTIGDTGDHDVTVGGRSCIDELSGRVGRVVGSGRVEWVVGSGSVGRVGDSGRVEWVVGSGRVEWVGDSGSVESAAGTSTVHLYDNATLTRASSHVAVFLHTGTATVSGGHVIDLTDLDLTDPTQWADHHGCPVDDGHITAYKAVRDDWKSSRGTAYETGTTATCDDFTDVDECGGGLHFSPTPPDAREYDQQATRFVELRVPLRGTRPITDGGPAKAKAQSVTCVREVDLLGRPIGSATTGAVQ